jgi:hypothetical protein
LTCSAHGKRNWEAECGTAKRKIRWDLNDWWQKVTTFGHNGQQIALKQHLAMYHMFTEIEHRGMCEINGHHDKEEKCMGWIVGLKFAPNSNANSNDHLTEVQQKALMETLGHGRIGISVQIKYFDKIDIGELDKR